MCGIAGMFDRSGSHETAAVSRMLDVQSHRGPDGCGTWADRGIVLGHRRLAIIDISHDGAQPMSYADGRYHITYNGEIYNYIELREELAQAGHTFQSASDTEVLLAAYAEWGSACLHRLNGMFAFAIWDRRERSLFCARDRCGVKPFVYTWDGQRFAFASETKALHAAGHTSGGVDANAVYEYLARGYVSEGRSFHADVHVLQPGSALMLTDDRPLRQWEWWQPERTPDSVFGSFDEWSEEVARVLDDAVRLRLRSDVPVGAHLSGGLDSSAVSAAAARHSTNAVQAFTGAFTDDAASDERKYARAVAQMSGMNMHEVEMSVDDLPDHFERILWHMDEPIAGPGIFPQMLVCKLAADNGVTVVLGGQGGDELFGGYLRHRAVYARHKMQAGGIASRAAGMYDLAQMAASQWRRVKRTSTRVADDRLAASFLAQVDDDVRQSVRFSAFDHGDVRDLMWHDLRSYLPALLQVEDRTSMAFSLESRTPILDYRLVELALRAPTHLLFKRGEPKPMLRAAVADWLPKTVANRRDKKGFPTPLHWWKERDGLRALVEQLTVPGAGGYNVPAELSGDAIFSDQYLAERDGFQASELWTVMSVNGWLSRLQQGSYSRAYESPEQRVA